MVTKGKSKKLIVYQDKGNGAFFIRSTKIVNGRYVIKPIEYGKALSPNVNDSELGKWIREILKNCD